MWPSPVSRWHELIADPTIGDRFWIALFISKEFID
jgi:hypothetical protein